MIVLSRPKTIALLFLVLMSISLETAYACSPAPSVIEITCDGKQNRLFYDQMRAGARWSADFAQLALLSNTTCGSEIPATAPRLAEIVAEYGENFSYFGTSNLEFTPYRPDILTRLEAENLNLLTCRTNFIEVIDEWIVHYKHRPDYCGNEPFVLSVCGSGDRIMLLPFLSYLYSNPTTINQLYLGGILLIAFLIGWLLWRQRSFFNPTWTKGFFFLLVCPALFFLTGATGFSLDIGTLGWAAMVWILVSTIASMVRYLKTLFRFRETPV